MQIEPLVKIDQVREGDLLLISDGRELTHAKAQRVKVSEHDGTEVIFNLRKNKYFNVGMYLDGKSWAKDVRIVRMRPKQNIVFLSGEANPLKHDASERRFWVATDDTESSNALAQADAACGVSPGAMGCASNGDTEEE